MCSNNPVLSVWLRTGDDEDEVFERIVSSIKECAAYAEEKKVLIGLHNHNHGQIPATGDMVVKLLNAVDSPYFVGLLDSGQWYGSPGIGAGSMAYGKPDGEHGTPRGELDPEYDYLDSIKTAADSGKLVQVRICTLPARVNVPLARSRSRCLTLTPFCRYGDV